MERRRRSAYARAVSRRRFLKAAALSGAVLGVAGFGGLRLVARTNGEDNTPVAAVEKTARDQYQPQPSDAPEREKIGEYRTDYLQRQSGAQAQPQDVGRGGGRDRRTSRRDLLYERSPGGPGLQERQGLCRGRGSHGRRRRTVPGRLDGVHGRPVRWAGSRRTKRPLHGVVVHPARLRRHAVVRLPGHRRARHEAPQRHRLGRRDPGVRNGGRLSGGRNLGCADR